MGLLQGIVLEGQSASVVTAAREKGLLVVAAGPEVVRVIPPLNVGYEELEQGLEILEEILA